jgi:hypothetical protein
MRANPERPKVGISPVISALSPPFCFVFPFSCSPVSQIRIAIITLLAVCCIAGTLAASQKAVWQIGAFDLSSSDLNQSSSGPPLFGFSYPKT